jgi:type VI secretion system secreted protein Hcp
MASDAFLKVDSVTGESTATNHTGEMEILSFSFGASNPSSVGSQSGGSGTGKVSLSSFTVSKLTDSGSCALFNACCTGTAFASAVVTLQIATGTGGQLPYLVYTFSNIYVDSINWGGSGDGSSKASETVSFSFASVSIAYSQQAADGSVSPTGNASWNVTTNSPGS